MVPDSLKALQMRDEKAIRGAFYTIIQYFNGTVYS